MHEPSTSETDHDQTVIRCFIGGAFAFVAFASAMIYLLKPPDSWHYAALLLAGVMCGLMSLLVWWLRCADMRAEKRAETEREELGERIDSLGEQIDQMGDQIDRLRMILIQSAAPSGHDEELPYPTRINGQRPRTSH